jgi:hypothetical protein
MQQSATLQPSTFVDLNVLPEGLRPRRYPAWYVLGVVGVLGLSLFLIPLQRVEQAASAETARLEAELELIEEELARIQVDFGRARGFRQQLEATEAAIAELSEERQAVLGGEQELSKDLFAAMAVLPLDARLASVTGGDGQLTLAGQAGDVAQVLEYVGALERSGRFSEARIASLAVAGGQEGGSGVSFTVELTQ